MEACDVITAFAMVGLVAVICFIGWGVGWVINRVCLGPNVQPKRWRD